MKTSTKAIVAASLASLALGVGGCSISVNDGHYDSSTRSNRVSERGMEDLVRDNQRIELGMRKSEALAIYPSEFLSLKSSSRIEGRVVEEWRVQAYNKSKRTVFRRWLYFLDGELVEHGDSRRDYDTLTSIPDHWNH